MAVSQVEEATEVTVDPSAEVGKVAVAVTAKHPQKIPPWLSTRYGENAFVAWNQCEARIPLAPEQTSGGGEQSQNGGGETVCCLAKCMLGTADDSCNQERIEDMDEKWIADSSASFHITHSADRWSDV